MAKGIEERHARSCRSRRDGRCDCEPTFRADVWDGRTKQRIRRTFADRAEAQGWRRDALIALRRGRTVEAARSDRLRDVVAGWLDGARRGAIRNRSGDAVQALRYPLLRAGAAAPGVCPATATSRSTT